MVMTLLLIARVVFKLTDLVTITHVELMNKIMLATGSLVGYAYAMEFFVAWYSGNEYERYVFINRATGPYAWAYWIMITCNVISPQLFWSKKPADEHPAQLRRVDLHQHRHVVRALRDHRDLAAP
jgi:hypothetical protein